MEKRQCLARLTNWDKTAERLAPCMTACRIVLCKNTREGDSPLCAHCKSRPVDGKYQTRMIHGLLTEPIPDISRLYGGPWYWMQVDKHGEPTNKEWLAAAMASQAAAEEAVAGTGWTAWKVQRLGVKEVEMRKRKAEGAKAKAFAAKGSVASAEAKAAASTEAKAAAPSAVGAKAAPPAPAKKAPELKTKGLVAAVDPHLSSEKATLPKEHSVSAEKFVAEVIRANDVKSKSLRKRMLAWFKVTK